MYNLVSFDKCLHLYNHHPNQDVGHSVTTSNSLLPCSSQYLPAIEKLLFWFLSSQIILPVLIFYLNGIIQPSIFCFCLFFLNMFWRFIQIFVSIHHLFLWLGKYSIEWIYHGLVINSPIDEHLHLSSVWDIMTKLVLKVFVELFFVDLGLYWSWINAFERSW